MKWVLLLTIFLGTSTAIWAHEEHEVPSSTPQTSEVSPTAESSSPSESPTLWETLLSHPHNKVVHFPIALGLFAFLLFVLALRWPDFQISAEVLVLFGFLASVVALILGELQKSAFVGTEQESLMLTHERFGWATAIGFFVWLILMRWKPTRNWAWLVGLGIALLVSLTGFFGGQLAHTIGS